MLPSPPSSSATQLASYAAKPTAAKATQYATAAAFSLSQLPAVMSGGYLPNFPPSVSCRAFAAFFWLNDIAGQHLIGRYLLGDRDNKINELSAKLHIDRSEALKLLVEPGQTLTSIIQKIKTEADGEFYLTVPFIRDKLGCSSDEALLMLAEKHPAHNHSNQALGVFLGKLAAPRLAVNVLAAWALDQWAYAPFTAANEATADAGFYQWLGIAVATSFSVKWLTEHLGQRFDRWRLSGFLSRLDQVHRQQFQLELQRATSNDYQLMPDDEPSVTHTTAILQI